MTANYGKSLHRIHKHFFFLISMHRRHKQKYAVKKFLDQAGTVCTKECFRTPEILTLQIKRTITIKQWK